MASGFAETAVGAAVLAVAAGFIWYAAQHAEAGGGSSYELTATFRKAEGVTVGGDVRIAGVKVGSVRALELDPRTYQALVRLSVSDSVALPDDSSASVASDGLLGGAHVSIQPGGSETMLVAGDAITFTQGSVSIMDLVGRAITGGSE
ncbi:outer membrane lipid asymmetry maintenance protein MlaD [Rubrimonas cliftonensis]|uniref:Phospholipid/cholesterol/gamma-HCH transport system substrate-binding protein n=1 Tax=Rubrimonas cliftonensis TaxID=89524 RepID=A0A1H3YID3_9RHOB|nr:outer membrane lipid asymmetry maintenance protein MlaD [Rubrimonas cliftonensis]SEA11350.1 phospholipid/cholesterol/gamma-HCH transport system substrate-binding protein [Rubrimonas cliftonensis]